MDATICLISFSLFITAIVKNPNSVPATWLTLDVPLCPRKARKRHAQRMTRTHLQPARETLHSMAYKPVVSARWWQLCVCVCLCAQGSWRRHWDGRLHPTGDAAGGLQLQELLHWDGTSPAGQTNTANTANTASDVIILGTSVFLFRKSEAGHGALHHFGSGSNIDIGYRHGVNQNNKYLTISNFL